MFYLFYTLQGVATSRDKVGVLVDTLLSTHDPLAFPAFLRVLNSRYPEVIDELRLELQYQQVSWNNLYLTMMGGFTRVLISGRSSAPPGYFPQKNDISGN